MNDAPDARAAGAAADWLEASRRWAENELEQAAARLFVGPPRLVEALRHALLGGGKRLRPAIVRLACTGHGGDDSASAAPAVALELLHTYSLVHDDLPCMDDDELRRGRPTCHVVYGEALAVLVGDALQAAAFEALGEVGGARGAEMTRVLARAAGVGGMVGGQALDLEACSGGADRETVERIHALKTAALFAAAGELGVLASPRGADPGDARAPRAAMAGFGEALGRLFQATDDLLDVSGDAATLGKTPGKDAAAQKATLVAALGVEGARAAARDRAEEARRAVGEAAAPARNVALELIERVLARTR